MKNIIFITIVFLLSFSCSKKEDKLKQTKIKKEVNNKLGKNSLMKNKLKKIEHKKESIKITPFENKLVYRHIENGINTFINMLDKNTKKIDKFVYPNKIESNIIYEKSNNRYYFLENKKLMSINPLTGEIKKVLSTSKSKSITLLDDSLLIVTNKLCRINKDLGTTLSIYKNEKLAKEVCLKGAVTRIYLNENEIIYYTAYNNKDKNSIYSFNIKTDKNEKLISKGKNKILPILFQNSKKLIYFIISNKEKKLFEISLSSKEEKEINISFLKKELKVDEDLYFTLLSGFYLNDKNYIYIAVWNKKNQQKASYWLEFNSKIDKNFKKLDIKNFSYDIYILSKQYVLIGNKLLKLF